MRWIVTVVLLGAQTSALPPPFPREGATRMFDNARVQVWDVAWLRREYPLHRHPYDLVVVYYAPGDRIITSQTGERRPVSTPAWDTAFRRRGLTHIEEGTSDPPLRAVFIEMKDEPRPDVLDTGGVPPFPAVAGKQLLDNDRTTVWEFVRWPAEGRSTGIVTMRSSRRFERGSRRCRSRRAARRTRTRASRAPSASTSSRSSDRLGALEGTALSRSGRPGAPKDMCERIKGSAGIRRGQTLDYTGAHVS